MTIKWLLTLILWQNGCYLWAHKLTPMVLSGTFSSQFHFYVPLFSRIRQIHAPKHIVTYQHPIYSEIRNFHILFRYCVFIRLSYMDIFWSIISTTASIGYKHQSYVTDKSCIMKENCYKVTICLSNQCCCLVNTTLKFWCLAMK